MYLIVPHQSLPLMLCTVMVLPASLLGGDSIVVISVFIADLEHNCVFSNTAANERCRVIILLEAVLIFTPFQSFEVIVFSVSWGLGELVEHR